MHMGPVFCVRSLVGSSVANGVRRFSGLRLSALRPSLRRRGAVGGSSSAYALTIATGCFAAKAVDRNGRLGDIKRQNGFEAMVFRLARERRGGGMAQELSCLHRYRHPGKIAEFRRPGLRRGKRFNRG
jgi:hypothetical protein